MNREDEIKEILKGLLNKTNEAIDNNFYSDNMQKIVKSSKEVLKLAQRIQEYVNELDKNDFKLWGAEHKF